MASEITTTVALSCSKDGVTIGNSFSKTSDMSGSEQIGNTQTVGTSAEALVLGDVSTIGYLQFKNKDATNYVEIDAVNTFDAFPQKVLAGETILLKPQTTTIYVKANTAPCSVWSHACEL